MESGANMGNGGNGSKSSERLSPRATILVAVVSSVLGATGGPYLLVRVSPDALRPDPFTGEQGKALETRVTRIEDELHTHMGRHPDLVNQTDRRITRLETQIDVVIENQRRMIDKLGEHMEENR